MNTMEIPPTFIRHVSCNTWQPQHHNDTFCLGLFLEDHPYFRATLQCVGVPYDLRLGITSADVEKLLGHRFSADFSTHHQGRIGIDLAHLLVPEAQERAARSIGYMFVTGSNYDQFHVAVAFQLGPDLLDRSTVLHEYGHYVEQRVATRRHRNADPLADRSTAFADALRLVRIAGAHSSSEHEMRRAADEFVAWFNAIWLSWITGMDPRLVVVGMVLDAISSAEPAIPFLERCISIIAPVITDREVAQRFFCGSGSSSFENTLRHRSRHRDVQLCQQIDHATAMLFRSILIPRFLGRKKD